MNPAAPLVSILMAVRDGEPYLAEALDSMLSQQGVDFEFVVVDDGSTDGTSERLAACRDPRLVVIRNPGRGLVSALNTGIAALRGAYVARMDSDDVALPGRLAAQAAMLDADPELDMVHASARIIDARGRGGHVLHAPPLARSDYRELLLGERPGKPIVNPTVMMRRSSLVAAGGYRDSLSCEDHEFFLRILDTWKIQSIPEIMLLYRQHLIGISRTRSAEQIISNLTNSIAYRYRRLTGIDLFDDDPERYAGLRAMVSSHAGTAVNAMVDAQAARRHARQQSWGRSLRALASLGATMQFQMLLEPSVRHRCLAIQMEVLEKFTDAAGDRDLLHPVSCEGSRL